MKFSKNDEVIVNATFYPDRDKLGFECIKLPDGQCIHKNNVLIVDRIIDNDNVKCIFKKFRDDQPTWECIVPIKYLKHSAKNLGVGSKVQFIPGVRCVQSGKVGRIVKIDPSGVYHFERDDKKGSTYECRSYELIDINDNIKLNFSERLRKCFNENLWEIDITEGSHFGVFNWECDCIYEGSSLQECIDYCNKNNHKYRMSSSISDSEDEIAHFSEIEVKP